MADEERRALLDINQADAISEPVSPKTPLQKLSEGLSSLGDKRQKAGTFGTTFSIMKVIIGAGSFVIPAVTAQIGIGGLLLSATVLCLLCAYCAFIGTSLKQELTPLQDISMSEFARLCFPKQYRLNAWMAGLLEVCIVLTSVFGCAVYLSFTGGVLTTVYCGIAPYQYVLIMGSVVAIFIVLQALLLVYRQWDPLLFLSRSSLVGFLAAAGAAVATCVLGAIEMGGIGKQGPYLWFDASKLPDSYGNIAFLFAVALFMFPLHSSIDRPSRFKVALVGGYSVAWIFNVSIGAIGYAIFGHSVQGIIVNSLTPGRVSSSVVQLILSFDIFFTFLVVVVPSSHSLRRFFGYLSPSLLFDEDDAEKKSCGAVFRALLAPCVVLVICLAVAIFVPGVDSLQGLVAALGLSVTGICFPALAQLVLRKNNVIMIGLNVCIIAFGLVAGGYTLYQSFSGLISFYEAHGAGHLFSAVNCTQ